MQELVLLQLLADCNLDQSFKFLLHLTKLQHYQCNMNAFKLIFSAKACFKVVVKSIKIQEAIDFLLLRW